MEILNTSDTINHKVDNEKNNLTFLVAPFPLPFSLWLLYSLIISCSLEISEPLQQ